MAKWRTVAHFKAFQAFSGVQTRKKGASRPSVTCLERLSGSPSWTRTNDLGINSPALYQLSYRGTGAGAPHSSAAPYVKALRQNLKRVLEVRSGIEPL